MPSVTPAVLSKKPPAKVFSRQFLYLIMIMFYKKGFLKYPEKFTTKFMGTAASGISENLPCFLFDDLLQIY